MCTFVCVSVFCWRLRQPPDQSNVDNGHLEFLLFYIFQKEYLNEHAILGLPVCTIVGEYGHTFFDNTVFSN